MTSNILTGQIQGDWLPMTPQSFSRNINAVGTFTGALNLSAGNVAESKEWVSAVENQQSVLWVFQDQVPVWVGIIWDWPHMSILDDTLPISASTMESLFSHRLITDDLSFTDADIFDVFRALAAYALGKVPTAAVAGFTMGSNESGITTTISYAATDFKAVYDAWNDLVAAYSFEYSIRPAVDQSGNYYMSLDLACPQLGLPLVSSALAYNLPGNLLDYRFTRTGSTSANLVYATASSSGTLAALNANSDFETDTSPWTGINGATLTINTAWANSGSQSCQFNGNGSASNPAMQSESDQVTAGAGYTLSAMVNSAAGWTAVSPVINWYTPASVYISSTAAAAVAVPAATPTAISVSGAAPANAGLAVSVIQMTGKPSSGVDMEADDVVLSTAAPSSGNWQSSLPHGEDLVVLAGGYPLLEEAVSLTTVTVTQQAQIDAYADGFLPSVAGTQLAPLLILGAGQIPAAKDTVLGSYCYFNATSPLHPANPDGSPGLQLVGRVTGWTLGPPSASQSEYTWIQLGQIEDIDGTIYIPSGAAV